MPIPNGKCTSLVISIFLATTTTLFTLLQPTNGTGVSGYTGPEALYHTGNNIPPQKCLNASYSAFYGWANSTNNKEIVIEVGSWESANIMADVVFYLLRDIMGYRNVTVVLRNELITGENEDNYYSRCAKGFFHINPEIWEGGFQNEEERYVDRLKLCTNAGSVGYLARNGIYVTEDAIKATENMGFVDYYRSIAKTPGMMQTFAPQYSTPQGKCNLEYCKDKHPTDGEKSRHLSKACEADKSKCVTFFHNDPSWAGTIIEGMSEHYSLPFSFEYFGGLQEQQKALEEMGRSNTPAALYAWTPSLFLESFNLTRVSFPDYSPDCYAQVDRRNLKPIACDFEVLSVSKFVWAGLREYDISAFRLTQKISMPDSALSKILKSLINSNSGVSQKVCDWLQSNPLVWGDWVPFLPSTIDFTTSRVVAFLPISDSLINVEVSRHESSFGSVNATFVDIDELGEIGKSALRQEGLAVALNGVHYGFGRNASENFTKVLRWRESEKGSLNIPIRILKPVPGMGIILQLSDITADSASFGTHRTVIIELQRTDCSDVVPGKEGGFAIFENFNESVQFSLGGTVFSIAILVVFLAEYLFALLWFFKKPLQDFRKNVSRKVSRKFSTDNNTQAFDKTSNEIRRKESFQEKFMSVLQSNSGNPGNSRKYSFFKLSGFSYKPAEMIMQIHPVLNNIYPILAVFTDFPQILAIILAPDVPWLRGNLALDIVSFSSFSFEWYFWVLFVLVLPWCLYLIFLLTGVEQKLANSFYGRIFLFPSDYLVPIGASVLFIPAMTNLFRAFECVKTKVGTGYPDILLNADCDIECWGSQHWAYAVSSGIVLLLYWPLAHYASSLWQSVSKDTVQVAYRPKFFLMDNFLKTYLCFSRVFLRQYINVYYALMFFVLLVYCFIFLIHKPCKVPWVTNLRALVYVSLLFITVVVIASWETSKSDSVWPYAVIGAYLLIAFPAYFFYDNKQYPKKVIHGIDETRQRIRQFLEEHYGGDNASVDSSTTDVSGGDFVDHVIGAKSAITIRGSAAHEAQPAEATFDEEKRVDWCALEEFMIQLAEHGRLSIEEYEFIAFLFVSRSETMYNFYRMYNPSDPGPTYRSVRTLFEDFYKFERVRKEGWGGVYSLKTVPSEIQRHSGLGRIRKRTAMLGSLDGNDAVGSTKTEDLQTEENGTVPRDFEINLPGLVEHGSSDTQIYIERTDSETFSASEVTHPFEINKERDMPEDEQSETKGC